jgi:asparagine synthetase B (glutamine-hydrolysing)
MTTEQAPLIDSALKVIFCDNDIENGCQPELFGGLFASGDLEIAFAVAEAHLDLHLDASLDRAVNNPARRTLSATSELVEVAKAVNRLRQSKGIEYLIPDEVLAHLKRTIQTSAGHKRKYDELLDRTEREARLRAEAKRVAEKLEREERTKRRDGLKGLQSELDKKTQELVASRSSLRREQMEVKSLKRSLECQICREEPWDTATTCGHLFSAECIRHWREENSAWAEVAEGIWVFQAPRCPVCRLALSERDLRRIYV